MSLLSSASSLSRSGSLVLPDNFAHHAAPTAAPLRPNIARSRMHARGIRQQRRPNRSLVVKAELIPGRAAAVLASVRDSCTKFLGRYDPVTTGIGSLLVTGYCVVVHGQDVGEALNIAAFATVLGMVLQEVLFNDGKPENHA